MKKYIDQCTAAAAELAALKDSATPHLHGAIAYLRAAASALQNHQAVLDAAAKQPPAK